MYKYRYITQTSTFPKWLEFFCLLANYFLLFCRDLAKFIFPTLLADIQRPNLKSVQGSHPVGRVRYSSCPL